MNLLILPLPDASLNNTEVSMDVQELQTVVAKENEQLKKGGSTRLRKIWTSQNLIYCQY